MGRRMAGFGVGPLLALVLSGCVTATFTSQFRVAIDDPSDRLGTAAPNAPYTTTMAVTDTKMIF